MGRSLEGNGRHLSNCALSTSGELVQGFGVSGLVFSYSEVRTSGPSISFFYLSSFSSSFLFLCLFLDEGLSVQPRLPRN